MFESDKQWRVNWLGNDKYMYKLSVDSHPFHPHPQFNKKKQNTK